MKVKCPRMVTGRPKTSLLGPKERGWKSQSRCWKRRSQEEERRGIDTFDTGEEYLGRCYVPSVGRSLWYNFSSRR